jgi:hypothetical protein
MNLRKFCSSQQAAAGKTKGSSLFGREQGEKNLQYQYNGQQPDDAASKAEKNDAQSFHSDPFQAKDLLFSNYGGDFRRVNAPLFWQAGCP